MAVNYGQVAIVPKGEWNVETQYKVNNLVSYDGSSYVAKVQPPVGTLPTDTSYWQVSAAGTKKATADSLGTVMPDGTTTSVGEDGKLSVNTAQQNALGVVKGSDDITVGEDGTLAVNTTFEQATELANIIAGEAIKSVLGKVSKAIATTMSLDENALLKNMISGIDVNDSNKVPSSAYIHTLVERIGMGTELVSGLGDLTTGLNTVNNNLSKWKFQGDTIQFDVGTNSEAPLFFKIRSTEADFYQLTALSGGLELSKTENGAWTSLWKAATKDDLTPAFTKVGSSYGLEAYHAAIGKLHILRLAGNVTSAFSNFNLALPDSCDGYFISEPGKVGDISYTIEINSKHLIVTPSTSVPVDKCFVHWLIYYGY